MSSDFCSYPLINNISFLYADSKNLEPGVTVCIFDTDFVEENNLTSYLNIRIILIKFSIQHTQHFHLCNVENVKLDK